MPDNLHPIFAAALAPYAPVTVETADGWLVIAKALKTGSVSPPYQYQYAHEHYTSLEDAEAAFNELEAGEWRGWSAVTIVPTLQGVPLGAKEVVP